MNDRKDDNLDRLLKDWAAAAQPDEVHLETLRERILQAADQLEGAGTEATGVPHDDLTAAGAYKATPPATWPRRLGWFALGAAAAATILAAMVLLFGLGPDQAVDSPPRQRAEVPPDVRLDRQQLASHAALFAAMKEVFPSRLTWMAETDGKVILGIEPETQVSPAGSEAITVRVVVMGRRRGETTWSRRWSVDCIVQDERFVELTPQDGSENRLALWTHLLPDGMIAIDTSLGLDPPYGEASSNSGVQQPQVPQQILDLRTDENEYRVFQTVAVLPKEVG